MPAGFCYQVLRSGQYPSQRVLHGLNGIYLPSLDRWIRVDPRGNTNGISAQFSLEEEQWAFSMVPDQGEYIYNWIYNNPAHEVVSVLSRYTSRLEMWPELSQCIDDNRSMSAR